MTRVTGVLALGFLALAAAPRQEEDAAAIRAKVATLSTALVES